MIIVHALSRQNAQNRSAPTAAQALFRKVLVALLLLAPPAYAETIHAAVAANFTAAFKQLELLFERQTGHHLVASFGSTGLLFAQISNGAPFDLFLAADHVRPRMLVDSGKADADSYFIYASGRLALWSPDPTYVDSRGTILFSERFARIAVANPKTAPYGQAAYETLRHIGKLDYLMGKIVTGENIAQTQQFVSSGNVPLGFVALAQVIALPDEKRGSYWIVPREHHTPIWQAAVSLSGARQAAAAAEFLAFLRSPVALAIIEKLGYDAGPGE